MSSPRTSELSFRELVFSDLARYRDDAEPSWLKVVLRCTTIPGMIASLIVRAQQCLGRSGHLRLANILRTVGVVTIGADFGPNMQIGTGLMLVHPVGVNIGYGLNIGNNVTLAAGVTAAARDYEGQADRNEYATICDGAMIGTHAVLVGGVRIGRNAAVGANAVVLKDVPDNAIVFGSPARQVGVRELPNPTVDK
ncbi:MAG: serine O-acetyltransferase [Jatrophihabitans sp.]